MMLVAFPYDSLEYYYIKSLLRTIVKAEASAKWIMMKLKQCQNSEVFSGGPHSLDYLMIHLSSRGETDHYLNMKFRIQPIHE